MTCAWLHNPKMRPADLILTKKLSTLICNPLVFQTVGTYHHESCVIMIITRLLAKLFGGLVLLSATIFIIVIFNERETARVLLLKTTHWLLATLQGGRDIEATCPQTHVDYFAETALSISFFTFLVSTFGTAFTVFLGWKSDREFKLKIVQLACISQTPSVYGAV
jgi:hypothetical protein